MKLILMVFFIFSFSDKGNTQSLVIKKKKGLYGVRDKTAKRDVIPYEYDAIEEIGLKESFFILSKNGKQGIVDAKNEILFSLTCDSIVPTNKNLAVNYYVYDNSKIGYINYKGEYLPADYDAIKEISKKKLIVKKNDKYGLFHSHGEIIYDFKYDEILSFTEEYLCAKVDNNWLGIRNHEIIHEGEDVLFHKPEQMASCVSCAEVEESNAKFECTQKYLNQIITENFKYPEKAVEKEQEGFVVLAYTVDEKGMVVGIEMLQGVDRYFEEECKRVIQLFPKFIPAIHEGKAVKCVMPLVIRFKLK